MRRFNCGVCDAHIEFDDAGCRRCGTELGYFHEHGDLLPITSAGDAKYRLLDVGHDDPDETRSDERWRCLNSAWGCNWMVPTGDGNVWCASCRLTRGRPDGSNPEAVQAWSTAEAAKRRLVAQLEQLGLPITPPAPGHDDGLVFDLVFLPESVGVTGHRPGVITLDLREVDHAFREAARMHFGEEYRTLLGHLRHETGHHFWNRLVVRTGHVDQARELFGDERIDYAAALEAHYGGMHTSATDRRPDPSFLSDYASVHPSEDWAETFAHYLHLRDGIETADTFGLSAADEFGAGGTGGDADRSDAGGHEFGPMLGRWRHLARGADELAQGLGHRAIYGVTIAPEVEPKLRFVHERVMATSLALRSTGDHAALPHR